MAQVAPSVHFCASQDILDEVEEKLRDKFGFSPRHPHVMTLFVQRQTEALRVVSIVGICRDADDNRIVAASLDSRCTLLVTGDSDILVLKKYEGISIVDPRQFMDLLPAD